MAEQLLDPLLFCNNRSSSRTVHWADRFTSEEREDKSNLFNIFAVK
jgi:hypothetical protein